MDLVLKQKQKQNPNLTMTTELRQAIGLLQFSTYELYEYLKEQELDNPLIELEEQVDDHLFEGRLSSNKPTAAFTSPLDYLKSDELGMREKLIEEANFLFKDRDEQQLIRYILSNIDDNGYFDLPINEDNYDENDFTIGIHLLQKLGPIGIGARNLKECLQLQITYAHPEQDLAEVLIQEHLALLANRKWEEIASLMDLSLNQVKEVTHFIQTLNPRPCAFLADFPTQYLYPDIVVEYKDGNLSFHLNDDYLPTIHFKNNYTDGQVANHETSQYIKNKLTHYKWLMSSIEQRRQTIINIMHVIIRKQEQFFFDGMIGLQPLILKDVAEEIRMHESTVSRATMNKIVQTPKGCFDLRIFFTTKLDNESGEDISQAKVKALLQDLIAKENKQKPLSDQHIANYFKTEKNIPISRRTINKYREELNIASSRMRKEF